MPGHTVFTNYHTAVVMPGHTVFTNYHTANIVIPHCYPLRNTEGYHIPGVII